MGKTNEDTGNFILKSQGTRLFKPCEWAQKIILLVSLLMTSQCNRNLNSILFDPKQRTQPSHLRSLYLHNYEERNKGKKEKQRRKRKVLVAILIFGKKFSKQKIFLGVKNPFDSVEGSQRHHVNMAVLNVILLITELQNRQSNN